MYRSRLGASFLGCVPRFHGPFEDGSAVKAVRDGLTNGTTPKGRCRIRKSLPREVGAG